MKWLAAIKLVLTMDCHHAMPLISGAMDRELSRSERAAVRLHVLICRSCRRARRQFHFLRHQLRQVFREHTPEHYQTVNLSSEARESILRTLQSAMDEPTPPAE